MSLLARLGWRNLWRNPRRTGITAIAMAIGVAFCMALVVLIDGVYGDLFDLMVSRTIGHAQIHHPDWPKNHAMWDTIEGADTLVPALEQQPEIQHVSPRIYGVALLGIGDEAAPAQLVGIDPVREQAITGLADQVVDGRSLHPEASGEILLGTGLARRLKADLGSEVVAMTQSADGSLGNALYEVVGVVDTGSVLHNRSGAWLVSADVQDLLVLPHQVHEIALLAADEPAIPGMVAAAERAADGLLVRSWLELNPQLAEMLKMSDASSGILMFIVFGVASLGVLNTMLMSVFERTRELGMAKALGLSPSQVARLVLWETTALCGLALLIGVPLGLLLDGWLVFHGLDLSGVMPEMEVMGARWNTAMMGEFDPVKVVQLATGLVVISVAASLWPAIRAARLKPVDAMREV